MTFAEADAQYELIKQRFLAGGLNDEQYDEQLRDLMVVDDDGRWWAKSRENGLWHYYDAEAETWTTAVPPLETAIPPLEEDAPPPVAPSSPSPSSPSPVSASPTPQSAQPQYAAPDEPTMPVVSETSAAEPIAKVEANLRVQANPWVQTTYSQASVPKWAAVVPDSEGSTAPGVSNRDVHATVSAVFASGNQAGATAGGYSAHDFAPVPELGSGLKIVLCILSFLTPLLGLVLFAVYRTKPVASDRAAARLFLILGVLSLMLYGLCGVTILMAESALFGAGRV